MQAKSSGTTNSILGYDAQKFIPGTTFLSSATYFLLRLRCEVGELSFIPSAPTIQSSHVAIAMYLTLCAMLLVLCDVPAGWGGNCDG